MSVVVEFNNTCLSMESITPPLHFLSYATNKRVRISGGWRPEVDTLKQEDVDSTEILVFFELYETILQIIIRARESFSVDPQSITLKNPSQTEVGVVIDNKIFLYSNKTANQNELALAIQAAIPVICKNSTKLKRSPVLTKEFVNSIRKGLRSFYDLEIQKYANLIRVEKTAYRASMDDSRIHLENTLQAQENLNRLKIGTEKFENGKVRKLASKLSFLVTGGLYKKIRFDAYRLLATTNHIDILWNGYCIPMGVYTVVIDMSKGVLNVLGTYILHDSPEGYTHPHISDESVCWGSASPGVQNALSSADWPKALAYTHALLQSYNTNNPYIKISQFSTAQRVVPEEVLIDDGGGDDACDGCDERFTPYCINVCDENEGNRFTCDDCSDLGSRFCFNECEFNGNGCPELNPCDNCSNVGDGRDIQQCVNCEYNELLNWVNPCDTCKELYIEDCEECEYRDAVENAIENGTADERRTEHNPDLEDDESGDDDSDDSDESDEDDDDSAEDN